MSNLSATEFPWQDSLLIMAQSTATPDLIIGCILFGRCKTSYRQLLTIQNPAKVLAPDAKEIKQVTRYLASAEALQKLTQ